MKKPVCNPGIYDGIVCIAVTNGYIYFPHMHVHMYMHMHCTGALYVPAGAKDFVSGDSVKCDLDMDVLAVATAAGEGANDHVLMV